MGTSKSNSGPKSGSSLLPSWADETSGDTNNSADNNENGVNDSNNGGSNTNQNAQQNGSSPIQQTHTSNWGSAKRTMGRFANNGSSGNSKSVGRSYVKAFGGAKNATRAAKVGINTAVALGAVLSRFSKDGVDTTLRKIGLSDCIGKDADYALQRLVDVVSPTGATSEDAIARDAMTKAMANLYDRLSLNNKPIEQLDSVNENDLREIILDYIKEYIFTKCCYQIGISIENKNISPTEIIASEAEMKRFIGSAVNSDFKDQNILDLDFGSDKARKLVTGIVEQAYLIIGK